MTPSQQNQPQQPPRRGRPPKVASQNGNELPFSEGQSPNDDSVPLEVEEHDTGGILSQASQVLAGVTPKLSKNQRYKQNKKARANASTEQLSDFIITLLTLILSALVIPENLKPNEDEINAFSVPATNILLRHVPLASKLSQDALDVIGMIGALSAYYIRTRDAWLAHNATRQTQPQTVTPESVTNIPQDDPFAFHPRAQDIIPEAVTG